MTTVSGSGGDGPVVGASVTVVDANGASVLTTPVNPVTDGTAKFSFTVPSGTPVPIVITVNGGTDMVTGAVQDFPLNTAVTSLPSSGAVTGNANPLSTLAVASATGLGSLTAANLATATSHVLNTLGFGFPEGVDPITTPVTAANAAAVIKASEAAAELIRRTAVATSGTLADTITNIANDLTTGTIDGQVAAGVTASPQAASIAATLLVQQATISIEALTNNMTITRPDGTPRSGASGANFVSSLNGALTTVVPTVTGAAADIAQVAPTRAFITQAGAATNAANTLTGGGNASLAALQTSLGGLVAGTPLTPALLTTLENDLTNSLSSLSNAGSNATLGTNVSTALADTLAPVITLTGANPQQIATGSAYVELGATVTDNVDTGLIAVIDSSAVNTSVPGPYTVSYVATDAAGNLSRSIRTVVVVSAPVAVLPGAIWDQHNWDASRWQ